MAATVGGYKYESEEAFSQDWMSYEDKVIGFCFVMPERFPELRQLVEPDHFYRPDERRIFRLACEIQDKEGKLHYETLWRAVREGGFGDEYDRDWLIDISRKVKFTGDWKFYCTELGRFAGLSRLRRNAMDTINDSFSATAKPEELRQDFIASITDSQQNSSSWTPTPIGSFCDAHPAMKPVLIDGLLRVGETCNIIAPPKVGKSWLVSGLAWSVATGRPWLGRDCTRGRVLMIDNELHPETASKRMRDVAFNMQIDLNEHSEWLHVFPLRGRLPNIIELQSHLASVESGYYSLIVLDALYRMIPQGYNENSNADMMRVYNQIDQYAKRLNCAFCIIHHASKGDQAGKSITDIGAGAGSISRAADSHLVIRPHENEGHAVLEGETRSFSRMEPLSIKFEYPIWHATTLEPQVKQKTNAQDSKNREADERVLEALEKLGPLSSGQIRSRVGMGPDRVNGSLYRLRQLGKVDSEESKSEKTGKMAERFFLACDCTDGCTDGCTDQISYNHKQ